MKVVRYFAPLLITAGLIAACTGGDDDLASSYVGSASSSGGRGPKKSSSGYPGSSGHYDPGYPGYPYPTDAGGPWWEDYDGSWGTSSSSGWSEEGMPVALRPERTLSFTIGSDVCSKPMGICADAQSFTVDLVNAKLTTITCVETAGSFDGGLGSTVNATTTRSLTADEVAKIKGVLPGVYVSTTSSVADGGPGHSSGKLEMLEVSTKEQASATYYGIDAGCGPRNRTVHLGWQTLYDLLRSL